MYFKDKHGQRIFLSGANMAWNDYSNDFGNGGFERGKHGFDQFLRDVRNAGGNTVRVWVHCEGRNSPAFDHSGHVSALQKGGSLMVDDLYHFLDLAYNHKILVFFVLWNGAQPPTPELSGLISTAPNVGQSTDKLASYLNHLKAMVNRLKFHPGLGGWEIMNEFNGLLNNKIHDVGCHDSQGYGGGWAVQSDSQRFSMRQLQSFISRQAAAIHSADPLAQITTSCQDIYHETDGSWGRNFMTDSCLADVGGGRLTFYQVHTYAMNGAEFDRNSPVFQNVAHFNSDKPMVVGEFSQTCSHLRDAPSLFKLFYDHAYAGAWIWQWKFEAQGGNECRGDWLQQLSGIRAISSNVGHGYTRIPDNIDLAN